MNDTIRVCIVGAGSSYTPELISGILGYTHEELPVTAISLYDINEKRLAIVAGLAQRMIRHRGREICVSSGTELDRMLSGSDFVITQIRVGGMDARYLDESIPLKYGVIGQETTGPGGMFKALRTIEPMIAIADAVARCAPNAFILNYTNPSGIITEAVARHSKGRLIGLCSGIPSMQEQIVKRLDGRFPNLKIYCVGLNHLGFMHRFVSDGKEVTRDVIQILVEENGRHKHHLANPAIMRLFNAVPIAYTDYFFYRNRKVKEALGKPKTRAQEIMEIERSVLDEAARPDTIAKPQALVKRGGGGYSDITFSFMKAIFHDTGDELVCSVQNRGAVNGIDDDAAVELVAKVDRNGATPIPVGDIPLSIRGLVHAVKAYETLTIEAAITRRRDLAIQALLNHPLMGDIEVVEPLFDELLTAHGLKFH